LTEPLSSQLQKTNPVHSSSVRCLVII